jgi:hypothetical protein
MLGSNLGMTGGNISNKYMQSHEKWKQKFFELQWENGLSSSINLLVQFRN